MLKPHTNRVRTPAVDPRKKANEANQGLTVHLLLELACLFTLLDLLGFQGLNPCPVLTNLHGEPGGHALGLYL
jgi:hypothetical protein